MDRADELPLRSAIAAEAVNDSKTPSRTVHVGSLRGPVILDVITRAVRASVKRRPCSTASMTSTRWMPRARTPM